MSHPSHAAVASPPAVQFISKTSNFLIPIIGWSMYLTGHVPLKRMDRRSQMARRL